MDRFFNSPYWEERELNIFSVFMALMSVVILNNYATDIQNMIIKFIVYFILFCSFFIIILLSHFFINSLLDYLNNKGDNEKIALRFFGVILMIIDIFTFFSIIIWATYESISTSNFINLLAIPIYWFIYYQILMAPIYSIGAWLFNEIKSIETGKNDLQGEI